MLWSLLEVSGFRAWGLSLTASCMDPSATDMLVGGNCLKNLCSHGG